MPPTQTYQRSDTIKSLYTIANKSNVIAFFVSVFLYFYCGIKEFETIASSATALTPTDKAAASYFMSISEVVYATAMCSLVYALFYPLIKIRKYPHGRFVSNTIAGLLVIISVFSVIMVLLRTTFNDLQTALSGTLGVIAAIAAITGWVVNHQIAAANNRVNQTLNLILQTRISSVYQEHETAIRSVYSSRDVISKEDVKDWIENPVKVHDDTACEIGNCTKKDKLLTIKDKKHKALVSCCYMLNYYEFLASGVNSGLLDEELLYQTVGGMLLRQNNQMRAVIDHFRESSKKSLEHLIELEERWQPRHRMEDGNGK
ncbi:DUF4760 domain-containing protein [Rheinheimera sp.]|uniref:DUF4760 domain-containing protein n=1 Tax=Rheinheimera sp. TaxID=1869214 RepID=UPI003D2CE013